MTEMIRLLGEGARMQAWALQGYPIRYNTLSLRAGVVVGICLAQY